MGELSNLIELSRVMKQPAGVLSRDRLDVLSPSSPENISISPSDLPSPIRHVRGIAVARLSHSLSLMFNALDDTLFELVERAYHVDEQQTYLESMRLLRSKRWQISDQFKNRLNNLFDVLIYPDASPLTAKEKELSDEQEDEQEIVQIYSAPIEDDALAILVRMINDARQKLAKPLVDIEQRLDSLVPCQVSKNNNPLDPQQVCDAFLGITTSLLKLDNKINSLILGQFYRHVISHLPKIIKQVNQIFSRLGVMPCQLALEQYELLPAEYAPDNAIQQKILRHKVTSIVNKQLEKYSIRPPKIAIELFQGPWLLVMVDIAQKQGFLSSAWDNVCEFTGQILESFSAEYAIHHRIIWLKSLSLIVQGLLSYLHQAGLSAQEIDHYLLGFEEAHRELLDALVIHEVQSSIAPLHSTQNSSSLIAAADVLKPFMRRVQQLQLGRWVELTTLQGQVVRCKLAEKQSGSQRFIFVNKQGKKIFEQEPIAVAQALREGLLKIIESKPLLERYKARRSANSFSNP